MAKYLVSFPASAMTASPEELPAVDAAARGVIREAKAAGVYVFGGGLDSSTLPVRVHPDGAVERGSYPQTREFDGGFCVLELGSRDDALLWAGKLAKACRCAQELRVFMYDPES